MTTEEILQQMLSNGVKINQLNMGNGTYAENVNNYYGQQPAQGPTQPEQGDTQPHTAHSADSQPQHTALPRKAKPAGRRLEYLFEKDRQKDEELTAQMARAFMQKIEQGHWQGERINAQKEAPLNRLALQLIRQCQEEQILPRGYSNAGALYRFMRDDCHLPSDAQQESFCNVIRPLMQQ